MLLGNPLIGAVAAEVPEHTQSEAAGPGGIPAGIAGEGVAPEDSTAVDIAGGSQEEDHGDGHNPSVLQTSNCKRRQDILIPRITYMLPFTTSQQWI
jgi:hypothetical protein